MGLWQVQDNLRWLSLYLLVSYFLLNYVTAQLQHNSWINHHRHNIQRPDPRWQLFREQPFNHLGYNTNNYYHHHIPTAAPLAPLPPLIQRQPPAPEIVQRQRNEGNFYRATSTTKTITTTTTPAPSSTTTVKTTPPVSKRPNHKNKPKNSTGKRNRSGYAAFEHKVVHVTTPTNLNKNQDYRKRRSFQIEEDVNSLEAAGLEGDPSQEYFNDDQVTENPVVLEQKHYHDIFMHFAGPQSVAFGHTETQPGKFIKRFESLNKGNRYRGEVTWHDALTGGYGTQQWDLAQGSLQQPQHDNDDDDEPKFSEKSSVTSIENQ